MILGGWLWRTLKHRIVTPYNPANVKNASYDVSMGHNILIYRWMGFDLPGFEGSLYLDQAGKPRIIVEGELGSFPAMFDAGDIFLAETVEYFRQPRGVSMKFMLKSSQARNFLEHLHAGFGDPGFHGKYTLEFCTMRRGYLYPNAPVGQMIPEFTLGTASYKRQKDARYRNQVGVTASRNDNLAFRPIDDGSYTDLGDIREHIQGLEEYDLSTTS